MFLFCLRLLRYQVSAQLLIPRIYECKHEEYNPTLQTVELAQELDLAFHANQSHEDHGLLADHLLLVLLLLVLLLSIQEPFLLRISDAKSERRGGQCR